MAGEKKWKMRAFLTIAMWSGWIGLLAADAAAGGGAWQNIASSTAMHWCVKFSAVPEIGACGHVGRYFPAKLPSEGRSKRGASVGVLIGWNGGRRKISSEKVSSGRVFR